MFNAVAVKLAVRMFSEGVTAPDRPEGVAGVEEYSGGKPRVARRYSPLLQEPAAVRVRRSLSRVTAVGRSKDNTSQIPAPQNRSNRAARLLAYGADEEFILGSL